MGSVKVKSTARATVLALLMSLVHGVMICPNGFYLQRPAHCVPCTPSSNCIGGQIVVKECTPLTNLECGCRKDFYFHTLKHHCFPCKVPLAGFVYVRNCSKFENSKVKKCLKNEYADNVYNCKNCTITCVNGIARNCTVMKDTVCKQSDKDKKKKSTSKTGEIIAGVLSAAVLVVVIILLVLYVKRRRGERAALHRHDAEGSHRQSVDSLSAKSPKEVNGNLDGVLHQPEPSKHNRRKADYQRANSNISVANGAVNPLTDSDQPSTIAGTSAGTDGGQVERIRWRTEDIADLSYESRQQLTRLLYPTSTNNWKSLAAGLGFSMIDIRNFEMGNDQCVHLLLQSYEGRVGASIPALHATVVKIRRHDAAKVLDSYMLEA